MLLRETAQGNWIYIYFRPIKTTSSSNKSAYSTIHSIPTDFGCGQVSSSGKRRQLASTRLDMKNYASLVPNQQEVKVKFEVGSKKITSATATFTISCVFLREGKATWGVLLKLSP